MTANHLISPPVPARPVRTGDRDIHVLGALVVIQHGDGRVVLAIRPEHRRRRTP